MIDWNQIEEQLDELLLNNAILKDEAALAEAKAFYEKGIEAEQKACSSRNF